MAAGIQQAEQQWPKQGQGEYQQRPGRRGIAVGQAHHHQGDQVLDDQHADCHPAVKGAQFALALQHLGRQHGTGKGQGDGQQQPLLPGQIEDQQDGRQEDQAGEGEVQQAAANHLAPDQVAELELETDGEQQQEHAEMGDMFQRGTVARPHTEVLAERGQGEAGSQVADQWRQAYAAYGEAHDEGEGDPGGFDHGLSLSAEAKNLRIVTGRRHRLSSTSPSRHVVVADQASQSSCSERNRQHFFVGVGKARSQDAVRKTAVPAVGS
ncbi:hypothetical protein D3C85_1033890 [compost metagenome]